MSQFELDGRPLPTDWVCRQSKSRNRHYFFNTATGESSWRHPLDIEKSSEKLSLKRNLQEDGSVSSGKKIKPSKKHKSDQVVSPSRSDTSKGSKRSSGHSNKNINRCKSPLKLKMGYDSNGYEHLCGNSKVGRINAWVNSVDKSYAPSEQGTCISVRLSESLEDSFDQSYHGDDVVIQTKSPSKKLNTTTPVSTASLKSKHPREHSRWSQGSSRKDIPVDIPKQDSSCSNSQGYTPFSPISPQPTFLGQNSVKMDLQPLPTWSVKAFCASQSSADAHVTNLVVSHGFENKALDTGRDKTTSVDDKEMAMDIDNYEELEDQIKVELQEIRSDFVPDPSKVSKEPVESSSVTYTDTLYIVLDTNVLLSHLKLISELKDFPIEGVVRPVLVVPWIVVQELDSLKSDAWKIRKGKVVTSSDQNGQCGVGALARSAVRFLHLCFENDHPRIRGQTACEANEVLSSGSIENPSNDDRILQCCLLFQRKAKDGHAVLFSNDQNLCSKAIINGVKAFTHKNLIKGLKELLPSNAVVLKKDHFKDYYNELRIQENLAEKRAKADDIACELQCVLREGLAVVVETEMRAAYDDLWDKVVYIKPPWTLIDLLQLLDKHWIAVFGLVLERKSKRHVDELRTHFGADKGSPGCLVNTAVIIEQAHALFEAIAARSSYNGAATKCLTAIIVLQRKCKEYQNDGRQQTESRGTQRTVAMDPPPQIPALGGLDTKNSSRSSSTGTEAENISERLEDSSELSSVHEISTARIESPHALVLSTFETIWNAVTQFSAQIFNGVGFPSPIPVVFLENLRKPTKSEAIHFLTRLCTCLACVVNAIQSVLHEPVVGEAGNLQSFENLLRAITQFFEQILFTETEVTVSDLCRFARDPDTRMGLIQGCSQLDRALATLQQCSTWVVSSEQ